MSMCLVLEWQTGLLAMRREPLLSQRIMKVVVKVILFSLSKEDSHKSS